MMGHIFISHASRDATTAQAIVAALEAAGQPCWISSRDIPPGANYQESIVAAIRDGRAMVLLLTEAANASDEVKKELALASAAGILVLPIRLGNIIPNAALSYELATRQWIEGGQSADIAARLAAALGAALAPTEPPPAFALPDKPSIAVLPFVNLGGDPDQEFFSDGVAEDILSELSRDRRMFVIARSSSFTYRGGSVDLRQVGRELGVRYVLDGSVRRGGERLRITARLNDALAGSTIWTERYDRPLGDLFALQDEITARVTETAGLAIEAAERDRVVRKPVASLTAWEAYQRGLWHWTLSGRDETEQAIIFFARAHALDPHFAPALVCWVRALDNLVAIYSARDLVTGQAEVLALARKAVAADPSDAEAHACLALSLTYVPDMEGTWSAIARARALNADAPYVMRINALLQIAWDRPREGRQAMEAYLRRDPRSPSLFVAQSQTMWGYYLEGDFAAAVRMGRAILAVRPDLVSTRTGLAAALAQLGDTAASRTELATAVAQDSRLVARLAVGLNWWSPATCAKVTDGLRRAGWQE